MSDASAGSGIPVIRTFQFDSSSIGHISSSVNLFRGDVNIPQTLFSLPSRHGGSGLDIDFSIFYQSNVFQSAELRNLEAPTGVLGLGWDLPLTFIEATSNGSPDPDTRTYTLNDNGSSNVLIRQSVQPFLFSIPTTISNTLENGKPVTPQVRTQFLELGLPLDAGTIASGGNGSWTLTDNANQQCFIIEASNASVSNVCYGGQAFQLRNYSFWHILYFPAYERWLIVTDDGIRKSFGGGVGKTTNDYATSASNSIAWQVWWTLKGIPAWTGPSGLTSGQKQVARAWYLVSASDPFGDAITYQYNCWARDANGLIPNVEQQVGKGGLPYTKAVYLTHVTDVFGRTVTASYADKLWSSASDAAPREYSDPHRATPSNEPNAYQDCYETKYLDKLVVLASNGAPAFAIQFGYSPRPQVNGPEQSVANVNSYPGPLQGDTFKRYLTSIVMQNGEGAALPGFRYDYHLDTSVSGAQPGALRTITFPQGGQASYVYQRQELSQCDRAVTIFRPTQTPSGAPRVFYGDNYVVTLWFDPTVNVITLQVWSWYGRWVFWQPASGIELTTGEFNSTTIDVLATAQFFAVTFDSGSDSVAYVFNKAPGSPGQFVQANLDGVASSPLTPTLKFTNAAGIAGYFAGSNFFAVSLMNPAQSTWQYDVFTYSWISGQWAQQSFNAASISYIAASGEYLVAVDSSGTVTLRYLNGALEWNTAPPLSIPAPGLDPTTVALTAEQGFFVMNCQSGSAPTPTNLILIVQWDANHVPELVYNESFTAYQANQATLQPLIVSNRLVAVNGILLRYNGGTWLANTSLVLSPMGGDTPEQRYAYAADYALQVVVDQGQPTGAVLGYDPNADVISWNTAPGTATLPLPVNLYDNFPAATDDYAVLGPNIYYRGTATNWTQLCSNPQQALANVSSLSPGFDSQSLVNEGPSFFSYADIPTNGGKTTVQSIVLKNAEVVGNAAVAFPAEKMYTESLEQTSGLGMSPQGPNLFVTYPITDATFDSASSITLRQYAGAAVNGPLVHYPVYQLTVNDQYQDVSLTTYVPNPGQAACDATGMVIKYYETAVYPGSDATKAAFGKTVNTYVNGLGMQNDNYLDMLDGLLLETAIYDQAGNLLESTTSSWQVLNQIASDPQNGSAPPIRLFGGWVARTATTKVVDGVTSTERTSFVPDGLNEPYTGRPATVASVSYNGSGIAETWTKSYTYGVEVNPSLRALNMRSALAQGSATEQLASGSAVTVRSSASVFSMWPSGVASGVLAPAQEASFRLVGVDPTFPYSTYTPGGNPTGWLLDQRVLKRTTRGQVIEQVDACGIATSIIYSSDLTFAVAHFANASSESVAYLGFEPYENNSSWTLTKTTTETGDVRTGTTSLRMPGGAAAVVSVSVTPKVSANNYVVGFWYKTPLGFQPVSGARCIVTCGDKTFSSAFAATNGAWELATIGVPISSSPPQLSIALTNTAAQDVLLDCVYAAPLPGTMLVRTYNPQTQNYTSTMDAGGRTRWAYYDPFDRPSIQVGPNGCPKELALRFLSRQGTSLDAFQPSSPNAEVTLHPADGGVMETFLDGSAWQNKWQPDDAARWQTANGALKNVSAGTASLTGQGTLPATWGLYFETTFPSGSPTLSVASGNVSVTWSGSTIACTAAGQPVKALAAPPAIPRHCLLIAGDGVMLFFADGQLIFSQPGKFAYAPPVITLGAGLGMTHLTMLASPRLGLSYNDGSGRQRQVHQLYGADSRVSEKIFDSLDRLLATTRVAPGSFGGGDSCAPLQYRTSFVDVHDFLNNFKSTGVMSGDVAAYYAGQSENGVLRSNDQNYPYYGTLWESSPRGRRVEHGLPGKTYAIADFGSTTPKQRATTQFAYGTNAAGDSPLPAGQYSRTAVTTPLKSTAISFQDQRGQSVGTWQIDTTGATAVQSAGLRNYAQAATGPEVTLKINMPNAILAGPQADNPAFVRTTVNDGAGRATSAFDPNAAQTQFLHDPCGRVRFVQPALDAGEQWFLYNKYDAVGRLLEQGTIPQAWNAQSLAAQTANMNWPDASVPRTVTFLWTYDGDGGTAAQIGQKGSCVTTTVGPNGPCVTTEVFTYDPSGRLVDIAMDIKASITAAGTISYSYNNLGELTVLTQPAGSPLKQIFYTINDQGWITAIGSAPNALDSIASYTYTIDGSVETESLGGQWTRSAQYLSPGWIDQVVTKSSDNSQSLSLKYTYNLDGTIASRQVDYAFAALSGSLADTYTYDGQGRLKDAVGSSNEQITSYDPNGNIWAATQGGKPQSFSCIAGKDQLSQIQVSGQSEPVKYDARGRMTAGLGRMLTYDDTTNLTTSGTVGGTVVQLGYGSRGQRVLKVVSGGSPSESVYFNGASPLPIAKLDDKVWSAMVYGPTGLIAIVSDQTYYPLKDRQQSVWAVVNSTGLVARYVYLPFGSKVADGPNPNVCSYRFMGQEWDSELSLCNFRARMYDPVLRRFLVPDTARQFPSPYVFCGNNPLNATDPSGDSSLWARIGIGLGMALTVLAGVALSVVTLGAAAPAAAAADAAAASVGIGGEAATAGIAAGVEAGTEVTATAGEAAAAGGNVAVAGQSAAEGGASAATEVGSGAAVSAAEGGSAAAPAATASSGWLTASNIGIQVLAGTVQGAGASGLQYDIQHDRDFTVAGFFENVGWGAVGGVLGAGIAQGPLVGFEAAIEGLGALTQFGVIVGVNGVSGAASSGVTGILANLADHQPWYQGVLMSIGIGLGEGVALAGLGEGIKAASDISKVTEETLQKLNSGIDTMVDRVLAAAKTQAGTGVLMVGGFFTVAGILVGGVVGVVRHEQN